MGSYGGTCRTTETLRFICITMMNELWRYRK